MYLIASFFVLGITQMFSDKFVLNILQNVYFWLNLELIQTLFRD